MSSDKDRLGEKLHEREKAEEDRYFAAESREKLAKIREETAGANVALGLCPRCGVALVSRDLHGVAVDDCTKCGGMWLDKGALERIVEVEGEGDIQRFVRNLLQ